MSTDLVLYQREGCPHCRRVRQALTIQNTSYRVVNVPRVGAARTELLALPGVTSAEVPVLVDGDLVIQGSDAILDHLAQREGRSWFGDPNYGLTRVLPGVSYEDAVARTRAALPTEGFGVLTEIDVKATLKKKIDADFRPYVILGACNPPLAFQAFTAEPPAGLLLPCNVVVTVDDDGSAVVSAVDPSQMLGIVERPALDGLASEVRARLLRVLERVVNP